jgi:hypothetical protein
VEEEKEEGVKEAMVEEEGMDGEEGMEEEHEVESVLGKKVIQRKVHYLVKLKNYEDPEWLPHDNLAGCQELVEEFNRASRPETVSFFFFF